MRTPLKAARAEGERRRLPLQEAEGERRRLPLQERIVDQDLGGYRCLAQPRERRSCDHVFMESPRARSAVHDKARERDLVDAAWLYAWARADLRRPVAASLIAQL